eukprot:g2625.t1
MDFSGPLKPHVPEERLSNKSAMPGPGAYESRSQFGKMSNSKRATAASSKFGRSKRESVNRQYISPKHQKSMPSSYTSQNFYGDLETTSTLGKMSNSQLKNNPKFGFGTSQRFKSSAKSSTANVDYGDMGNGATGRQINSKKKSSPSFGFGTQKRDRYNKMYLSKAHAAKSISTLTSQADFMIGSGAMGKQRESTKKSTAQYGFGTSQRGHAAKRYQPPNF